jgi:hypothetical protein
MPQALVGNAHDPPSSWQVFAITAIWRHLTTTAIVVIDDINFDSVRQGTADGCEAVGGCMAGGGVIAASFERRLTLDGSHTPLPEARRGYWNGVLVLVIDKSAAAPGAPGAGGSSGAGGDMGPGTPLEEGIPGREASVD